MIDLLGIILSIILVVFLVSMILWWLSILHENIDAFRKWRK